MNPKIKKVIDDIERTKTKIAELQALLPELERKRIDMENTEIIKLVRSANISPADLPGFLESLNSPKGIASASANSQGASHPSVEDEAVANVGDYPDYEDDSITEFAPEE